MIKIDLQMDKRSRGQFVRFAIQVNLSKPLVSKIRVSNKLHRIEYESLPSIYFQCGRFSHMKYRCPLKIIDGNKDNKEGSHFSGNTPTSHNHSVNVQERV